MAERTGSASRRRVGGVVVAVPARNEERLLPRCLASLMAAREMLRRSRPGVDVQIVLALDLCVDGSAAAAARFPVTVVPVSHGCVGATRDSAVRTGLARAGDSGHLPPQVWVANTDADTVVPPHWLSTHLRLAEAGADLVLGTVEPDRSAHPELLRRWHQRHVLAEDHTSVHGANLGIRADVWRAVGGFGRLGLHEDVELVHRAKAGGACWVATDRARVSTSGRVEGKTTAGFAGYLRDLMTSGPSPVEAVS